MIHKRPKPKSRGPEISVPGAARSEPPVTGGSSFATRVRSRRRKAQASGKPAAAKTGDARQRPASSATPPLLTKQERLAVAKGAGKTHRAPPAATPPATAPAAPPAAGPRPAKRKPASEHAQAPQPKPQREPDPGYVAVGRIQAPYGLKGELKVLSMTDNPDRFAPKSRLWAGTQPVTVAEAREAQGFVFMKLKGFTDRSSVEKFRNALLQVPESELPELEEGEFYRFQLIGLAVVSASGEALGTVAEVIETGATDVYRVTREGAPDLLLAATPDVVKAVELAARRIIVDPPEWT